MTAPSNRRIFAAEFIGTAVLVLGGVGSAVLAGFDIGTFGVALAFGLTLLALTYAIGPVSGCHVNPAVSIALWAAKRIESSALASYLGAQLLGGLFGGLLVKAIAKGRDGYSSSNNFLANGWGRWSPGRYDLWSTILVEIVFTALLVFVVLAVSKRSFPRSASGLAVGLTLALTYLVSSGIDSGGTNPARSIASAVFSGSDALKQVWVFVVFPILGGLLGVLAWLAVDDARLEDTRLGGVATETVRDLVS